MNHTDRTVYAEWVRWGAVASGLLPIDDCPRCLGRGTVADCTCPECGGTGVRLLGDEGRDDDATPEVAGEPRFDRHCMREDW